MCSIAMLITAINSLHLFIQQTFNECHFMPREIQGAKSIRYINHNFCIQRAYSLMSYQKINKYFSEWNK